jgi:predicted AAA+ superfamily ATPase
MPNIKIIFSGSSSLDLIKGGYDLSRRAKLYYLPGFSFREYVNLKQNKNYLPIALEDLLSKPTQFNQTLGQIPKIFSHFKDYLNHGYYPFAIEDKASYEEKIIRIIKKTLYEDIAEYYNLKTENLHYLKRMLSFLSSIPPGEINTNNLAKNLSIDHKTAFNFVTMLQETGLARMLFSAQVGNRILTKPEKIYLHNASLYHALGSMRGHEPVIGTLREIFLFQSVADAKLQVNYSAHGDFLINNCLIEVGGKNKTFSQCNKIDKNILLVKDDILSALLNTIPLYYFGFLY